MSRIKIIWRWNGEKIRFHTIDEWARRPRSQAIASIAAKVWEKSKPKPAPAATTKLPLWDLNAITKGIEIMRKRDMFLFTNIIYQALGGEMVHG